ncbi:hypothetical protein B0H14DRAFT_2579934 [Mycena olivaceomarginata]|nr:hypothetical protein B0H14DRAFT_2579934 [Mycena olivaceomarginata]
MEPTARASPWLEKRKRAGALSFWKSELLLPALKGWGDSQTICHRRARWTRREVTRGLWCTSANGPLSRGYLIGFAMSQPRRDRTPPAVFCPLTDSDRHWNNVAGTQMSEEEMRAHWHWGARTPSPREGTCFGGVFTHFPADFLLCYLLGGFNGTYWQVSAPFWLLLARAV